MCMYIVKYYLCTDSTNVLHNCNLSCFVTINFNDVCMHACMHVINVCMY